MKNYLSIDHGTTSSRAIIFYSNLTLVSDSQKEYDLHYPNDGWVELNPNDVLKTVMDTLGDVLNEKQKIEACGITNQRETTIVWSKKTGKPIYPGIVWQDRRTNETCNKLKLEGYEEVIKESIEQESSIDLKEFGVDTNEPDLFNTDSQNLSSNDLLGSSEEGNEEDDLEIPAFLRRQKN